VGFQVVMGKHNVCNVCGLDIMNLGFGDFDFWETLTCVYVLIHEIDVYVMLWCFYIEFHEWVCV
jgi:hypothetical protein